MERRPLVFIDNGRLAELPVGDSVPMAGAESDLGNPASDGQVLSSTADGIRSWVDRGATITDCIVYAIALGG